MLLLSKTLLVFISSCWPCFYVTYVDWYESIINELCWIVLTFFRVVLTSVGVVLTCLSCVGYCRIYFYCAGLTLHGILPQENGGTSLSGLGGPWIFPYSWKELSKIGSLKFFTFFSLLGGWEESLPHWLKINSSLPHQEKSSPVNPPPPPPPPPPKVYSPSPTKQ